MEEVDNIILESLRNIHCEIDEDIHSLKQFTSETVVSAIVCCLQSIKPEVQLPKHLPQSMSLRLKVATDIAEQIQSCGFRGDMGYQNILYCNEVELRRILMFLIEKLPRESNKSICNEETGYVPKLIREIEERMRGYCETIWIPSQYLHRGAHLTSETTHLTASFGHSAPLRTEILQIPDFSHYKDSQSYQDYCIRTMPDITRQCNAENLISSLLFQDNDFIPDVSLFETGQQTVGEDVEISVNEISANLTEETTTIASEECKKTNVESLIESSFAEYTRVKEEFGDLREELKAMERKLEMLLSSKLESENSIKDDVEKLNVKSKTLTVLSKEENLDKLKNLIDSGNERLLNLAQQWNDVQSPLLAEYTTLENSLSTQELRLKGEREKIDSTIRKREELQQILVDKESLEQQLIKQYQTLQKTSNRSSYTRRILEIIGNIKKQNGEINKILVDTKDVQKDIKGLDGQLSRSFTLSDELIFRDAQADEMPRRAYKLLAALHTDCAAVVECVTQLGVTERESRHLREQLQVEEDREMGGKVARVEADLAEVRREIDQLVRG